MAKKKDENPKLQAPNYEALTTLEMVDDAIAEHQQMLIKKDITEYRMKEDKRDYVAALNEQLKELKEEREFEMTVLSALEQHKQFLANQGGQVIPLPVAKN